MLLFCSQDHTKTFHVQSWRHILQLAYPWIVQLMLAEFPSMRNVRECLKMPCLCMYFHLPSSILSFAEIPKMILICMFAWQHQYHFGFVETQGKTVIYKNLSHCRQCGTLMWSKVMLWNFWKTFNTCVCTKAFKSTIHRIHVLIRNCRGDSIKR